MSDYLHHVSGFFAVRDQADCVRDQLIAQGIDPKHIHIFDKTTPLSTHRAVEDSNGVLRDILVDGAAGAAVGTGVGALAQLALVSANISLFVASPVMAPLVMLGWGAGLGGFLGAAAGAAKKSRPFSELVNDAIANGQIVLVVETFNERETGVASDLLKTAVGDYQDRSV